MILLLTWFSFLSTFCSAKASSLDFCSTTILLITDPLPVTSPPNPLLSSTTLDASFPSVTVSSWELTLGPNRELIFERRSDVCGPDRPPREETTGPSLPLKDYSLSPLLSTIREDPSLLPPIFLIFCSVSPNCDFFSFNLLSNIERKSKLFP